jgi:hypothetical protein
MITTAVSILLKTLEDELTEPQKRLFEYAEAVEKQNCRLAYSAGKTDQLLNRETKLFKDE